MKQSKKSVPQNKLFLQDIPISKKMREALDRFPEIVARKNRAGKHRREVLRNFRPLCLQLEKLEAKTKKKVG